MVGDAPGSKYDKALSLGVPVLDADIPMHEALRAMRDRRNHLALVESGGELLGLVTMQDLLDRLLPSPA